MLDMNSSHMNLHMFNRICENAQQEMGTKLKENEIEWTVNVEVLFFYSMIGHKPVGVNKHFMMLLIHNKFSAYLNHQISSKMLWDRLDSMYDMAALHESEIIPFPNEEVDYELPEDCHELLRTKHSINFKKSDSESELNKTNANSIKASKKITPKLKMSNTSTSTPKNNFVTPVASKPAKSQTVVKSETKTPLTDSTPKVKADSGSSTKTNKVKRSSSPFATKLVKSESASLVKEDSPDISTNKKNKSERSSSPAVLKKPVKTDSSVAVNSNKKLVKSDSSANGLKTAKTETPDNPVKKIKVDKDQVSKKGKTSSSEVSTKKVKVDVNGVKKKNETESSSKKNSESSSVKQIKTEVKNISQSSKVQEMEAAPSGSRKSSPVVKVKNDSSKKLKRPKVEESSKKSTPTPKRRRP